MGNGRVYFDGVSNRYLIDLSITAEYDTSGDDQLLWEASFRKASSYLLNATKGKMQLGRVGFLNDCPFSFGKDDGALTQATDHSKTFSFTSYRPPDSQLLKGGTIYTSVAMTQPLEITHELGHYVMGLADEYVRAGSTVQRNCTNTAASSASIMEFAAGHSVMLSVVGVTIHQASPIDPEVTNFCFPGSTPSNDFDHQFCGGTTCAGTNYQHVRHGTSCWDTIVKHFTHTSIPDIAAPLPHAETPVDWFVRSKPLKYSIAVFGSQSLKTNANSFAQIKNSAIGWAKLVGGTDNFFALVADTEPQSFQRDMAPISSVDELVALIKQEFDSGNSDETPPFAGLDQFDDSRMGSYQTLILVLPGNASFSDEPVSDFVDNLASTVASKFVSLIAVTIGKGPLATELTRVDKASPRVKHIAVLPSPGDDLAGHRVQNLLAETYFLESPGHGIVASSTGRLGSLADGAKPPAESKDKKILYLHPQSKGFDFPVYIEEGAESAYFVASHFDPAQVEFTLIRPNGEEITANTQGIESVASPDDHVQFYKIAGDQSHGRWIMRLRRIVSDEDTERDILPFHLVAASVNSRISMATEVNVVGNRADFEIASFFREPLDHIDARVDIFTREDFGINPVPIQSIALRRKTVQSSNDDQIVEVSTGIQTGSTKLDSGNYVAVFVGSNSGQAVAANNFDARFIEDHELSGVGAVPNFSRIDRQYFSVGDHEVK